MQEVTRTPTKELINKFQILGNRMNAFTNNAPLRRLVETDREMKAIRDELRTRGLYYAGYGKFVTVPQE